VTWPENKYTASLSLDNFRLGDDDAKEIDIGFEFPYSSVFAGSNGYLTFGEGDTTLAASADGHNALPRISALFTDLDPSDDSTYMYAYRGSGVFAVTYVNVKEYSQRSGPRNSFQVVLRDDGSITIAYSIVLASGVIGVRLSSRGALQQVDLSAGSRTCPAGSSNSDPSAYPIPLQPPETPIRPSCAMRRTATSTCGGTGNRQRRGASTAAPATWPAVSSVRRTPPLNAPPVRRAARRLPASPRQI